jgi:hypothetical protein
MHPDLVQKAGRKVLGTSRRKPAISETPGRSSMGEGFTALSYGNEPVKADKFIDLAA